ncbi:MAG TPA: putative zinc-binding metallopeptidase [Thermoleophilaceae bacterium]|nr:putative zinc-binding metallopeptidase [Thermoleophilaceae bacterium]
MRAFTCGNCGRLAPFESNRCLHCGAEHGFDWGERELVAFWPDERARCRHRATAACNAVVAAEGDACAACALTRTRPADDDPAGFARFAEAEAAKRRLVFELAELGLPLDGGLAFDMLSSEREPVTTGHADGVVTIDLAEVDDAHREAVRAQMAEPYRTVLGHLRHEIGHYYQPIVVADWDACRSLFGDEREDYQQAMNRHYEHGAPDDWPQRYVSAYATMHPWEDWAETFAHYLHIADTVQTALAYGVRVEGPPGLAPMPPDEGEFSTILASWLPLTYALNALNRSMGAEDLYPFVLVPPVIEKLEFVHQCVVGYSKH